MSIEEKQFTCTPSEKYLADITIKQLYQLWEKANAEDLTYSGYIDEENMVVLTNKYPVNQSETKITNKHKKYFETCSDYYNLFSNPAILKYTVPIGTELVLAIEDTYIEQVYLIGKRCIWVITRKLVISDKNLITAILAYTTALFILYQHGVFYYPYIRREKMVFDTVPMLDVLKSTADCYRDDEELRTIFKKKISEEKTDYGYKYMVDWEAVENSIHIYCGYIRNIDAGIEMFDKLSENLMNDINENLAKYGYDTLDTYRMSLESLNEMKWIDIEFLPIDPKLISN